MTDGPKSFEWDDAKSDACFEERGFSFADVLMIFAGPVIEQADDRKDYGEARIRAAGLIEGVPFMVVYTPEVTASALSQPARCTGRSG
nr:BrnT family toxin [Acetobacter persici]